MSGKSVKRDLDLEHLPPLTEALREELEALQAMPDGAIDYTDIPPHGRILE